MRRVPQLLALLLGAMLILPLVGLLVASSPEEIMRGLEHPLVGPALLVSLRTTTLSLAIIVVTGTPLAWWLARAPRSHTRWVAPFIELPIILPPAVVGVALLDAFGRNGLVGAPLGWSIPFTTAAVVMAQVVVAAPFYVQSAAAAFRKLDVDLLLVARTLGATSTSAFFHVAVPAAAPGLMAGAALCWARAVGELGATWLFAGSLPGTTQTMPLAIFSALESDVGAARAIAIVLALLAALMLLLLRAAPTLLDRLRERAMVARMP